MLKPLWPDECGTVVSAEVVLVLTVGVLATVVGLNSVATKVVQELNDVACAISALDQSFFYYGMEHPGKSAVRGAGFLDGRNLCDCEVVWLTLPVPEVPNGPTDPGPRPF